MGEHTTLPQTYWSVGRGKSSPIPLSLDVYFISEWRFWRLGPRCLGLGTFSSSNTVPHSNPRSPTVPSGSAPGEVSIHNFANASLHMLLTSRFSFLAAHTIATSVIYSLSSAMQCKLPQQAMNCNSSGFHAGLDQHS